MEIWKDVVGYEGLYQVSNLGNVRSITRSVPWRFGTKTVAGREMTKRIDKKGYLVVTLSKNNIPKIKKIHRLVACAFIPNKDNLPFINHKDECKENNNANNLEWCNRQYNNTYGSRVERARVKQAKAVIQCHRNGTLIREWESITEASSTLHIHNGSISECCKGKRKTAGGYVWKYGGA